MVLGQLAIVAFAILAAFSPVSADLVERWFSTGVYPGVQHAVTRITNAAPLALFDVLVVAAAIAIPLALFRGTRAAWRARRPSPLLRTLGHLVAAGALVYLVFLAGWGLNYRRVAMEDRLQVSSAPPTEHAVAELGLRAVSEMNRLHLAAHAEGWGREEWRDPRLVNAFAGVLRRLSDAPPAVPGRLKRTLIGPYFRWTGVDGMINPFGLEVLANPDLLPYERPFVAAHEWAHLAGYADESEANFVAFLTGMRGAVSAQYSAWLFLYWQVSGEVSDADRAAIATALDEGPRRDIDAIVTRLRRGRWPMLQAAGWAVYDQYLKANRVDDGVRSYGRVVKLILRSRFDGVWSPVRRDAPAPSR
jgi:hypothetical protein